MYPVMLDVKDRRCLVVGGGGVSLRKAQGLVDDGARVTVVSPEVVPALQALSDEGRLTIERREYRPGEAVSYALVIAATDDREVNKRIFADADGAGVWVNVADDPEICSFHLPARVRRGPLQLTIASAGEAPFVARRLRQVLDGRLGDEWSEWVAAASRFRTRVRDLGLTPAEQEGRFDRFFESTVDVDALSVRIPTAAEETLWLESGTADHDRSDSAGPPQTVGETDGGFVSLVGAGPGCPGLVTSRGLDRLYRADAVVYDRLAAPALPCDLPAEVELHPVGKQAGHHPVPQEEINRLLVRLARRGLRVVRFKGGDPYVFGRGGEEAQVLVREGVGFEVVPGVTSGVAAMAWAGIPVTHRREAVRLTLLTAHEADKPEGSQVRWRLLAEDEGATIIGYMGVRALPNVVRRLLDAGMSPTTPAAMVEQGTTAAQRKVISTLAELPDAVTSAGLAPPALFAIGPTIHHAEVLDWFDRLPLAGERLVVTAADHGLARALESAGAEVLPVAIPVTPAARVVISALPVTGCVVAGPDEVDRLHVERDVPSWDADAPCWCFGKAAATRAREHGWPSIHELDTPAAAEDVVAAIIEERR